jgi:hypothetical protein
VKTRLSLSVAKLSLSYINDVIITIWSNIFVKIVDCRVIIINRASHCGFNGGGGIVSVSSKNRWVIF